MLVADLNPGDRLTGFAFWECVPVRAIRIVRRDDRGLFVLCREGRQGEQRPADVIGAAIRVAKISVGDISEPLKAPSGRVRSGHAGAKARAGNLTPEQRQEIARKAAAARWK